MRATAIGVHLFTFRYFVSRNLTPAPGHRASVMTEGSGRQIGFGGASRSASCSVLSFSKSDDTVSAARHDIAAAGADRERDRVVVHPAEEPAEPGRLQDRDGVFQDGMIRRDVRVEIGARGVLIREGGTRFRDRLCNGNGLRHRVAASSLRRASPTTAGAAKMQPSASGDTSRLPSNAHSRRRPISTKPTAMLSTTTTAHAPIANRSGSDSAKASTRPLALRTATQKSALRSK